VTPTVSSFSLNPYTLYCDPFTCAEQATCDQIIAEECAYSHTSWTVNEGALADGIYHAALVPGNACSAWYQATYQAYPNSTHSFLAINNLINNYCGNGTDSSATAFGDSWSCFCQTFTTKTIQQFYTPCTDTAIGCSADPNWQFSPLITVIADENNDGSSFVGVGNPICSNPFCIRGREQLDNTFITPNLFQRSNLCPTSSCLLITQGFSLSTGVITSEGAVEIVNKSLFCNQSFTAPLVPSFAFFHYDQSNIWFWELTGQSITNPDFQARFDIINSSSNAACANIQYSNVTSTGRIYPWLGFDFVNTYQTIPAFGTTSIFFPLSKNNPPTQSELAFIDVTITGLNYSSGLCNINTPTFTDGLPPIYNETVQLNVISVDPPIGPSPDKPVPGQNSDGRPIPTQDSAFTLGGIAIIVMSVTFIIFGLFLLFNSNFNARVAADAVRWADITRFS
jgi:hypothetical protein